MKKLLYLLGCTCLLFNFNVTLAQRSKHKDQEPKFAVGIKTGINFADQSSNTATAGQLELSKIARFNGGVYFNYFVVDFLSIQPEVMISGKGVHWKDQYTDGKDLLTYIDVPVMIKFQTIKRLNIQAGPDFGYRLTAFQKISDGSEKTNIKDNYLTSDLGVAFGLEANLPFKLSVTARYVLGLKTVTNQYNDPWKNNFFQVTVGYRLFDLIR